MTELYVLNELAQFAEFKTLTAVAQNLNVSQPALTRSMKKLESELGVQLFNRGKNRITLNENGKIAAEYAKKVVEAEKLFEQKVLEYDLTHRIFNFASIAPMPITELTPILSQHFMNFTIQGELKDNEKDLYKLLDTSKVSLIVTLKEPKNKEKYTFTKLFEEHLSVVLPKNHPLAKKEKLSLKELAGEKILIYNKLGFWYQTTKNLVSSAEFFDQTEVKALKELAELTGLASFCTNFTKNSIPDRENKKIIPLTDSAVNVTFYCVCQKKNAPKLTSVFSQIKSIYGE